MPQARCPHCQATREISQGMIGRPLVCEACGGRYSSWGVQAAQPAPAERPPQPPPVARRPMQPPQAQPVVFIQATQPELQRPRRRRGNLGSRAASRFMLMTTAIWLLTMFGTVVYFAFALSGRADAEPTAWAGSVVAGSICMWCFETLIYGVAMIVLWVVRENFRD